MEPYAASGRALAQLRVMLMGDGEIGRHFAHCESAYVARIAGPLRRGGGAGYLEERVYACCALLDALRQEGSVFPHRELDFGALRQQVERAALALLSKAP